MSDCPICREPLATMDMGGLTAAYCSAHGIWLGHAEYQALLRRAGSENRKDLQSRVREARRRGYEEGRSSSFDRKRLARSRRKREQETREPAPEAPRNIEVEKPCPACGEIMPTETWEDLFKATPDVTVDRCEAHGVWFDTGELDVLVARAELDAARESEGKVRRAWSQGHRDGKESRDR